MKKLAIMLIFILLIQTGFAITAEAATFEKPVDGSVTKVIYQTGTGNAGTLTINAQGAVIANQELWAPDGTTRHYRLIVELKNVRVNTPGTLLVNAGSVLQVRYAQFDAVKTRFVIDVSNKPTYEIVTSSSQVKIHLNGGAAATSSTPAPKSSSSSTPTPTPTPKPAAGSAPSPTPAVTPMPSTTPVSQAVPAGVTVTANSAAKGPLSWSLSGSTCTVSLANLDIPALVAQGKATVENRPAEKMVQITLSGIDSRFAAGALQGNAVLYGILVSHNASQNTTSIRLSGRTALLHTLQRNGSATVLTLTPNRSFVSLAGTYSNLIAGSIGNSVTGGSGGTSGSAGSTGTGSTGTGSTGTGSTGIISSGTGTTGSLPGLTPVADNTVSRGTARTVPVSVAIANDAIVFTGDDVTGSRVYRMGRTIVVDMPGVAVPLTLGGNSALVRTLRVTSADGRLRAVISGDVTADWTVTETAGRLQVSLQAVPVVNLEGGDDADVVLRLTGTGIVSRYRAAVDLVRVDEDLQTSTFTFMFPIGVVNMGNGVFKTNDTLTKSMSVLSTGQSSFLSIAKQTAGTQFRLVEEADGNALTIRKAVAEAPVSVPSGTGRLVVLDAGHGGTDPGAVFEGIYESHVNLDITLRAEALLRARGVNVLLTRNSDVFVGLDQRTVIANNANASLFVSIHQNSMPEGMRGTMTMYYATSVNGRNYAQIMQDTLVPALGLGSLGLKSSSELVVLRKTKMPAILVEGACMSSPLDMAVIKTDAYRQTAAQAIADGVLKILATMN